MDYQKILNRVKKAIHNVENKINGSTVHVVDNDSDISELNGLVVILHPDYIKRKQVVKTYAEL